MDASRAEQHADVSTPEGTAWVERRVDALEGLRGWLALCVCWTHAATVLFPAIDGTGPKHLGFESLIRASPLDILFSADFAVRVFFVHSGFVLALKFFRTGDRRWPEAMLARRAVRLGLPVFATTMLSFCLFSAVPNQFARVTALSGSTSNQPVQHFGVFGALWDGLVGNMFLGHDRLPGAWWTMPVEFYCSIVLLAFLIAWPSMKPAWRRAIIGAFLAVVLVREVVATRAPSLLFDTVPGAVDLLTLLSVSFIGGAALAWFWARDAAFLYPQVRRARLAWWGIGIAAVLVGTFPSKVEPFVLHRPGLLQLVVIGVAVLTVAFVLATPTVKHWLELPLSRWLGRISFMVYLVHIAIQRTLMDRTFLALHDHSVPYSAAAGISFLLSFVVTLAVAHVLAVTVDRAAIGFGKKRLHRALGLKPH